MAKHLLSVACILRASKSAAAGSTKTGLRVASHFRVLSLRLDLDRLAYQISNSSVHTRQQMC